MRQSTVFGSAQAGIVSAADNAVGKVDASGD